MQAPWHGDSAKRILAAGARQRCTHIIHQAMEGSTEAFRRGLKAKPDTWVQMQGALAQP